MAIISESIGITTWVFLWYVPIRGTSEVGIASGLFYNVLLHRYFRGSNHVRVYRQVLLQRFFKDRYSFRDVLEEGIASEVLYNVLLQRYFRGSYYVRVYR